MLSLLQPSLASGQNNRLVNRFVQSSSTLHCCKRGLILTLYERLRKTIKNDAKMIKRSKELKVEANTKHLWLRVLASAGSLTPGSQRLLGSKGRLNLHQWLTARSIYTYYYYIIYILIFCRIDKFCKGRGDYLLINK